MNNAILPNLTTQSKPTMSSREIAQLTQKPHDNVLKLLRRLIYQGVLKNTTPHSYTHPQNNQSYTEFLSDKRDSLVIVARLSPEFTAAVVDRWQQLESQTPQLPNFTDPVAAARAWADEVEAKQVAIAKLEVARPKIAHYDNVVQRDNLLNATQVGQKVGLSALALNRVLDELGVYNKAVKRGRVFSQWVIDKGLGVIKQTEQGFSQALFTLRGEAWVIEQLTTEGVI